MTDTETALADLAAWHSDQKAALYQQTRRMPDRTPRQREKRMLKTMFGNMRIGRHYRRRKKAILRKG